MEELTIKTALVARTYTYRLLQMLFGSKPSNELLGQLFSEATYEALDLYAAGDTNEALHDAQEELQELARAYAHNHANFLEAAQRDYAHLLVGPEDLKAPPWECVYRTKERVLFQEVTLKVREAYRTQNMLPSRYPHVSDDHVAIELDFIGKLAAKAQTAFDAHEDAECLRLLNAQRTFIADHLGGWISAYAADVAKAAPDSLYACAGALAAAILPLDLDLIEELEAGIAQE